MEGTGTDLKFVTQTEPYAENSSFNGFAEKLGLTTTVPSSKPIIGRKPIRLGHLIVYRRQLFRSVQKTVVDPFLHKHGLGGCEEVSHVVHLLRIAHDLMLGEQLRVEVVYGLVATRMKVSSTSFIGPINDR